MKNLRKIFHLFICIVTLNTFSIQAQEVWQNVGGGLGMDVSQSVNALLTDTINNVLYAVGTFSVMDDSVKVGGRAYWNGAKWLSHSYAPTGGTFVGNATSIVMYEGKIFVGWTDGDVSYYNGASWQSIATFNDAVTCLAVYKDKLYAGGDFTKVNGVTANKIACWDGTKWTGVGGGVGGFAPPNVRALCVWNDKLYVGGFFNKAGGMPVGNIAAWDGAKWDSLSSGVFRPNGLGDNTGYVYSIGVYKNELIVGGWFDSAGGVAAHNIARWDGSNWYFLGSEDIGSPVCLLAKDNSLYAGGGGVYLDGYPWDSNSYGIVRWDGSSWHKVDNRLGNVYALAIYDNALYAGGGFSDTAKKIINIARLVDITGVTEPEIRAGQSLSIYPNPVTDELEIRNLKSEIGDVVTVTDLMGRIIERKTANYVTSRFKLQTLNYPSGIYFLHIANPQSPIRNPQCVKFVKQ